MTQDEIIRLCNDLGQTSWYGTHPDGSNTFTGVKFTAKELAVFVERVAAHEREACAKVCDEVLGENNVSADIRARGETK